MVAESRDLSVALRTPVGHELDDEVSKLTSERVMSRISDCDPTLWGAKAREEASVRLAWTNLHHTSRALVAEISALRERFVRDGLDRVVLCGMGGSSLAPEVICRAAGVELTVLDSSHPDYVRRAIDERLASSIVVVSSKSGSTVETDSQKRAFEHAFEQAGLDPVDHMVIVTDPESVLAADAQRCGYRLFTADPHVGGRYSALTAFGLVPSGLAGVDISALLDDAAEVAPVVTSDSPENPAARLGAFLGLAYRHGVDKIVLADHSVPSHGLADWIEQLMAESTGKSGRGLLPVVVDPTESNAGPFHDEAVMALGSASQSTTWHAMIDAPLAGSMLTWEYAIAVAGRLIGINPFDQPDVESAKQASRDLLEGSAQATAPAFSQDDIDVYGLPDTGPTTIGGAISWLLEQVDSNTGYLAVHAYLDRVADAGFAGVRSTLEQRLRRPVTFGWGPRFLHSTGQYHKGGPPHGVFLQVTADPECDLDVPGREFTFGSFIDAQAAGDGDVLRALGRPVLRLHLHDAKRGLAYVRGVLA